MARANLKTDFDLICIIYFLNISNFQSNLTDIVADAIWYSTCCIKLADKISLNITRIRTSVIV